MSPGLPPIKTRKDSNNFMQKIKIILESDQDSMYLSNFDSGIDTGFKSKKGNGSKLKMFSGGITTGDECDGITVNEESATENNDEFNILLNNLNTANKKTLNNIASPVLAVQKRISFAP